ncbi:hypothetical protein J1614_010191 [Plenodomus biglobosus]|nr:hypothetical protein J1614_010191 [Plenodomus biglobosus]
MARFPQTAPWCSGDCTAQSGTLLQGRGGTRRDNGGCPHVSWSTYIVFDWATCCWKDGVVVSASSWLQRGVLSRPYTDRACVPADGDFLRTYRRTSHVPEDPCLKLNGILDFLALPMDEEEDLRSAGALIQYGQSQAFSHLDPISRLTESG